MLYLKYYTSEDWQEQARPYLPQILMWEYPISLYPMG
jgi:hypothetical protein